MTASTEPLDEESGGEAVPLGRRERFVLQAPGYFLAAALIAAFLFVQFVRDESMSAWGVSREALREGRYGTIFAHMFAHGGAMHLFMNLSALLPLSATTVWGCGAWPANWLRFATLYLLSGLAGCLLFLLIYPDNGVPMLGASGAIFGLWGLVARLGAEPGEVVPLRSAQVWRHVRSALTINLILFALLYGLAWALDAEGGLAWEAHLGGFAFGLLAAPWFIAHRPAQP